MAYGIKFFIIKTYNILCFKLKFYEITLILTFKGLPHELLKEVGNEYRNIENREEYGLELMKRAADSGDVGAMIFVAEAYETGRNLGKNKYVELT